MKTMLAGFLTTRICLRKKKGGKPIIMITDKLRLGLEIKNINEILEKFLKLMDETEGRDFTSEELKAAKRLHGELGEVGLRLVDMQISHNKRGDRKMKIILHDYLGLPN